MHKGVVGALAYLGLGALIFAERHRLRLESPRLEAVVNVELNSRVAVRLTEWH
jgi:hypothetical protein